MYDCQIFAQGGSDSWQLEISKWKLASGIYKFVLPALGQANPTSQGTHALIDAPPMYWLYVPAGHSVGLFPLTWLRRAGHRMTLRIQNRIYRKEEKEEIESSQDINIWGLVFDDNYYIKEDWSLIATKQ